MHRSRTVIASILATFAAVGVVAEASPALANVTYEPYIQPGHTGSFGPRDQMVIAWQTDETAPSSAYWVEFEGRGQAGSVAAVGRVVDNYLSDDPSLPIPATYKGPRTNYYALLGGLAYDTEYTYRVFGPGLPPGGFRSTFKTRTRSGHFSFLVQGDEGFFPALLNSTLIADYEARIVHEMNDVSHLGVPGVDLPDADLALNTGDNVYTFGSEGSYRDFWFPVWNSDVDSNERGAPFVRHMPFYIVAGNHDVGSTGVNANLLASDTAPPFAGNQDGGDALVYYNNFYFPLNGPAGVNPEFTWNGDTVADDGFLFSYLGQTYTSPAAIEAFRASTTVGGRRQIDHMSNYSFDSGNAHFVFLDANPHLFDGILDGAALDDAPPDLFPAYPSILRKWLIDDLDGSNQTWKVVVFHQPVFSSGNATLRNSQMRAVAKLLEDHGVNLVFNGHEHNYQRTLPLRATATTALPATSQGAPAVIADAVFDGHAHDVPDGVLYIVEGAGGNRDFDGDEPPARGSGVGLDQDDSATGTFEVTPSLTVPQGKGSWLDTNLTVSEMQPFSPGAGNGPKITARFKAKVFSFADVVVNDDTLTLFQITEPLQDGSSATASDPAPFGTDVDGRPLNDPIPDTLIDPTTGDLVSPPATGTPALLDKFDVRKADLGGDLRVTVTGPEELRRNERAVFRVHVTNASRRGLNGTQVVVRLPEGTAFAGTTGDLLTVHDGDVVATLGRLDGGARAEVEIPVVGAERHEEGLAAVEATVRSSTAHPASASPARLRCR